MMRKQVLPYVRVFGALCVTFLLAQYAHVIFDFFEHQPESGLISIFFLIAVLFVLSFVAFYLPSGSPFPSFVVAIFLGIVAQPLLEPIVHEHEVLNTLVGVGATLILFGGGLETPFGNFKKLFWKICSLSFFGLTITAILFSLIIVVLSHWFSTPVSVMVAVLLGAVLASTDPASIIPILKQLRFNNRDTKDLIVSESAMTDVTGTLLTVVFLSILTAGGSLVSVMGSYQNLFTPETGIFLLKQVGFGILLGVIGFLFLELLTRFKRSHSQEFEVDAAYFFFVPLAAFALTLALGGSGYLAAFIVGLLFVLSEHLNDTARFFNHIIDGFLKPAIFLLLGALVDVQSLLSYALIGVVAAFIFMFIIRPIAVFITLGPFSFFGKNRFTIRELLFISFVRETGAIPAALLITVVSLGIPGMEGLLPIGMWVILLTLIIQPSLTPFVARYLDVGEDIKDDKKLALADTVEPAVVLASRGESYKERLPMVMEWALKHNIHRVILLHCLENKFTPELAKKVGTEAQKLYKRLNRANQEQGKGEVEFSYVSREGFLHENINEITKHDNVALIFVGRKALDYRLSEYREMSVPFYFMD